MTNYRTKTASIPEDRYSESARKVLILGNNGESYANAANPIPVDATLTHLYENDGTATVGSNVTISATEGDKNAVKVRVFAPTANPDATVKIYKDSVSGGNLLKDTYLALSDSNGDFIITENNQSAASSQWIVLVEGGTGTVLAKVMYN